MMYHSENCIDQAGRSGGKTPLRLAEGKTHVIIDTDNFSWAVNQIKKHDLVFVDLETTGLEPFNGDRICGIAVMAGLHVLPLQAYHWG